MKKQILTLIALSLLVPSASQLRAQNAPPENEPQQPAPTQQEEAEPDNAAAEQPAAVENAQPLAGDQTSPADTKELPKGELRLNFRNAPLDLVLDYLSKAAGFTIVLDTKVRGSIDVWSNHPVTTKEALEILDGALAKNGYAAIRYGKTLKIVSREAANGNVPILQSTDWESIPMSDVVATYIIPVRYINAEQLITTLEPLKPKDMQLTANADSNSMLVTDTQAAIRRIAHIAALLDSSVSSVSTVKIIPLKYSDAKTMADTINNLYSNSGNNNNRGNNRGNFRGNFFRGFGRGGGLPFPPGGND